jgi:hypothetical protein
VLSTLFESITEHLGIAQVTIMEGFLDFGTDDLGVGEDDDAGSDSEDDDADSDSDVDPEVIFCANWLYALSDVSILPEFSLSWNFQRCTRRMKLRQTQQGPCKKNNPGRTSNQHQFLTVGTLLPLSEP